MNDGAGDAFGYTGIDFGFDFTVPYATVADRWPPALHVDGVPFVIDRFVEPGRMVRLGGAVFFHCRAEMDACVRAMNHRLRLRRPTKAMRGNARRRELLAQVRARTHGPYWVDEAASFTDAQWAQTAGLVGIDWGFEP